jgi:hypothetical protein
MLITKGRKWALEGTDSYIDDSFVKHYYYIVTRGNNKENFINIISGTSTKLHTNNLSSNTNK